MRVDRNLPISVPIMLEIDKVRWTLNEYYPKPSPPVLGQQVRGGCGGMPRGGIGYQDQTFVYFDVM